MFVLVGIALTQVLRFVERTSAISISGIKVTMNTHTSYKTARVGVAMGAVSIALGIMIIMVGTFRFYHVQNMLVNEKRFPVARISSVVMSTGAVVMCAFYLIACVIVR